MAKKINLSEIKKIVNQVLKENYNELDTSNFRNYITKIEGLILDFQGDILDSLEELFHLYAEIVEQQEEAIGYLENVEFGKVKEDQEYILYNFNDDFHGLLGDIYYDLDKKKNLEFITGNLTITIKNFKQTIKVNYDDLYKLRNSKNTNETIRELLEKNDHLLDTPRF